MTPQQQRALLRQYLNEVDKGDDEKTQGDRAEVVVRMRLNWLLSRILPLKEK
jgi:hypothetical protein